MNGVGICEAARAKNDIEGLWRDLRVEDDTAHELFPEWELVSEVLVNLIFDFVRKANAKAKEIATRATREFLDRLDRTRESRYTKGKASRKGVLPQGNGFRSEWSEYLTENLDNLYNS